jgi:Flp pilus assembly protein TadB
VNLPEDDRIAPPGRGDDGVPAIEDDEPPAAAGAEQDLRSLREDVEALIEDGKTYLETELVYQKTRAAFVAEGAKGTLMFGAVAILLAFLALVGLILGLILALTPLLTAWGASALVVGLLVIAALIAGRSAARRWSRLMQAIEGGPGK